MAESPVQQILGPPPAGSDVRTKILWYAADALATGIIYNLFDYGQPINTVAQSEGDPSEDAWQHVQVHYEDLQSADPADDQIFTLDVLNWTGGQPDSTWTSQDFDLCSAEIHEFISEIGPYVSQRYRCKELRFYRRSFNPREDPKPYPPAGGPSRISPIGATGGSISPQIPQATSTITEVTPSRRHWGRIYLPTLGSGIIAATGRYTTPTVDALANAYDSMLTELAAIGFRLVVPTTSSGGVYDPTVKGDWTKVVARTLQQVNGVRVDDIPDVHRSRRPKTALYRKILPTPTLLPAGAEEQPEQQPEQSAPAA